MNERSFNEAFDVELLKNSTILVDENLQQNCDFFILELVRAFNYTLFQWNDLGHEFASILGKYNVDGTVHSHYTTHYDAEDIIDDVYCQRMLGFTHKSKVNVFRSSTATKKDYYDYDLVVKIDKLKSGCDSKIDGSLRIISRDRVLNDLKYKIYPDKVVYFD